MKELTSDFKPYSDVEVFDEDTIIEFENCLSQNQYSDAKTIIDSKAELERKGFRALFYNVIEKKIQDLQIYLLNKAAAPDEYYSLTEPTEEEMKGRKYWIKPLL